MHGGECQGSVATDRMRLRCGIRPEVNLYMERATGYRERIHLRDMLAKEGEMHRDDCLITTVEEATEWLDRYRHTVGTFDPQVLKVIEVLEQALHDEDCSRQIEINQINDQLKDAEDRLSIMDDRIEKLLQQIDDLQEEVDRLTKMVDEAA